ncbi:MAG: hypothetical protein ABIH46_05440 [Chloroflexota bacterium]
MVELKASSPGSPMIFSVDGYRLVVMPMANEDSVKATKEAEAEQAKGEAAPEVAAQAEARPKRKRKGKGEDKAEVEEAAQAVEDEAVASPPDEAREPVAVA